MGDARWSATKKVWHLPNTAENRLRFKLYIPPTSHFGADKIVELEKFKRYLNTKRYSESTVKTYCESLKTFFSFYQDKEVKTISNEDVVHFQHEYNIKKKLSSSFQNQIHPVG